MKNLIVVNDKYSENRGSLYTIYTRGQLEINFVQDKISKSYQGVIRGFHGDDKTWKLISCLHGRIKLPVGFQAQELHEIGQRRHRATARHDAV